MRDIFRDNFTIRDCPRKFGTDGHPTIGSILGALDHSSRGSPLLSILRAIHKIPSSQNFFVSKRLFSTLAPSDGGNWGMVHPLPINVDTARDMFAHVTDSATSWSPYCC